MRNHFSLPLDITTVPFAQSSISRIAHLSRLAHRPIVQSPNLSTAQSPNRPIAQSPNRPIAQSLNRSIAQSLNRSNRSNRGPPPDELVPGDLLGSLIG